MHLGEAMRVAQDWHGGQASALYEFGSSGKTTDKVKLLHEIQREIDDSLTSMRERNRLKKLKGFVELHV